MSSAGATQGRISHAPCTLACLRHILEKGARVAPQGACSFRRSDILNLTPSGDLCSFVLRGKYTVYAVGGVQQEKHGSLWEQCQPMPTNAAHPAKQSIIREHRYAPRLCAILTQ